MYRLVHYSVDAFAHFSFSFLFQILVFWEYNIVNSKNVFKWCILKYPPPPQSDLNFQFVNTHAFGSAKKNQVVSGDIHYIPQEIIEELFYSVLRFQWESPSCCDERGTSWQKNKL